MTRRSPLPSAVTIGALATTLAVLFAGAVIWFSHILPAINDEPVQVSTTTPATPVTPGDADRWSGVARLTGDASCTGALVDTGEGSGPAYLLTAGHCGPARDLDANAVVTNQETTATATFKVIDGVASVAVPVARVAYSSMKGTDVSVLRLDTTLGALRDKGLRPYPIVSAAAAAGFEVTNVAVPADGIDPADVVLRQGACRMGTRADLVEFAWLFDQMQATNCPGVVGGSSGSPLFNGADQIVAMITTTTAGALPGGACYLGTPCERTGHGVTVVPDTSYAVTAAGLDRCFRGGTFGLSEACPLPKPALTYRLSQTVFTSKAVQAQGGTVTVGLSAGRRTPAEVGIAPLTDRHSCSDPTVYTIQTTATPTGEPVSWELPATPGFYVVCAAVRGAEGEAAAAIFQVDDTPPVRTPSLSVRPTDSGLLVEPIFSPPELSDFQVKIGPQANTDCADPTGYQRYRRIPSEVRRDQLPATVCVIGYDLPGNAASPWSQVLTP
ncbi:MAG: trypsin-like serine peptidase [Propionibacteriaceae bacterium]